MKTRKSARVRTKFDWSKIDPHEFESIIASCFSKLGYSIFQTKCSVDGGVDVIADKFDEATRSWLRFVIQVKRYSSPINVEKVRELNGVLDDFNAVKGILIGTSGFTKASKEFEKNHSSRVALWNENSLLKLLKAADLLDPEGALRKVDDPNLKSNRRSLICIVLRENRPTPLNAEAISESLRNRHKVVVPERTIKEDLTELSEHGDIIELEGGLYTARVLDVELKDICDHLAKEVPSWDFHFDERDLIDYVAKRFRIPLAYVQGYMQDTITDMMSLMKRQGILCEIGNRYFTEKGLESFRNIRLSKEQMRTNLLEFLKLSERDMKKPITKIVEMNKPITLLDKENPKKKIITFKQILPLKCTCGAFTFEIHENISLLVVPSSLKPKREEFRVGHQVIQGMAPENVLELLECSSEYVQRLKKLIADYKIGHDGASCVEFNVEHMLAILHVDLNLNEKSTIKEMIDRVVDESDRFQSFLIDLNENLPSYGSPKPLRTSLTVKVTIGKRKTSH